MATRSQIIIWSLLALIAIIGIAMSIGGGIRNLHKGCPQYYGLFCNVTAFDGRYQNTSYYYYTIYNNYSTGLRVCEQRISCYSGTPDYTRTNCSSVNGTHGNACYAGPYDLQGVCPKEDCHNAVAYGFLMAGIIVLAIVVAILLIAVVVTCIFKDGPFVNDERRPINR